MSTPAFTRYTAFDQLVNHTVLIRFELKLK